MTLVHQPGIPHRCSITSLKYGHDRAGTVRCCDSCGQAWVAHDPPRVYSGQQSVLTEWRREGRVAQWRRQRRCVHDWSPADVMIRWHCVKCGKDRDGMPK